MSKEMNIVKSIAKKVVGHYHRSRLRRAVERWRQDSTLAKYPIIETLGQLEAETVIVNTRHGYPLIVTPRNRWIDQNLWHNGSYELGTTHLLRKFLGSGETFIDIGANIGLMTIAASITVGPTGLVICFEPDHRNLSVLVENILLNKATNVCVLNIAVGDTVGEFNLFRSPTDDGGISSLVEKKDFWRAQVVSMSPLDRMLNIFPSREVSLVKIDVEGYEYRVIKGAQELLSRYKPIVIMEFDESHVDGKYNCLDAGAILLSLGYDGYFGNGNETMDTVLRLQATLESKKNDNMIFIHRDRKAQAQRCGIKLS
jgi:FkbM family methyltransferase